MPACLYVLLYSNRSIGFVFCLANECNVKSVCCVVLYEWVVFIQLSQGGLFCVIRVGVLPVGEVKKDEGWGGGVMIFSWKGEKVLCLCFFLLVMVMMHACMHACIVTMI